MIGPEGVMEQRFELGGLVATPAALDACERAAVSPSSLAARHVSGDWGSISPEDAEENEISMAHGFRILSSYRPDGTLRVWIITGANRFSTCARTSPHRLLDDRGLKGCRPYWLFPPPPRIKLLQAIPYRCVVLEGTGRLGSILDLGSRLIDDEACNQRHYREQCRDCDLDRDHLSCLPEEPSPPGSRVRFLRAF